MDRSQGGQNSCSTTTNESERSSAADSTQRTKAITRGARRMSGNESPERVTHENMMILPEQLAPNSSVVEKAARIRPPSRNSEKFTCAANVEEQSGANKRW